jgi:hypothetical protein
MADDKLSPGAYWVWFPSSPRQSARWQICEFDGWLWWFPGFSQYWNARDLERARVDLATAVGPLDRPPDLT